MKYNDFDLTAKPNYKMSLPARIKWWFGKRKSIKERAKRGWSRYDAWEFDRYLATVIGDASEYLAGAHMSHPWDYTSEEWDEKLTYISKCFKQYLEDNEYETLEEEERAYNEKMKRLREGFELLYEVFPELWD